MSQSSLRLRRATAADVRELLGRDIHGDFCIDEPAGYVAERDGTAVAFGIVTWDKWGRVWGWFTRREPIPAVTMHRCALEMLGMVRGVGEPALYAICNPAIPGAAKWLLRLGFARDSTLTHPLGPIYRCDLSI